MAGVDRAAAFHEAVLHVAGHRVSPGRHYFDCEGTILACYAPKDDPFGNPLCFVSRESVFTG